MYQIVESLAHFHSQGLVHGDVKLLNVVRHSHRLRLIDLDACCNLKTEDSEPEFTGCKFSSDAELWQKIRPKDSYVVRTFDEVKSNTSPLQLPCPELAHQDALR